MLSEAREELRATGRSSEDPDWQSALDSGMLDLIRAGRVAEAKELLRACLSSSSDSTTARCRSICSSAWRWPPEGLPKALQSLAGAEHLAEVVLLSTCNRTEIYAHATLFHPAMQDVRDFLADSSGVDPDEFADHLYTYHDDAAVAHLFGVAAGLDSMIIGEGEILGQVREAWSAAEHEARSGPLLSRTFRHAVEVGKRARTETGIGRHAVSVSSAAVALATSAARLARRPARARARRRRAWARAWRSRWREPASREIVVANRTVVARRGARARVGGRAIALDEVPDALDRLRRAARLHRRARTCSSSAAPSRR